MRERTSNSGVVAEGQIEGAERQLPPLNFSLPEHFLLFGKFSSKIQIVGLKMPHSGEIRPKLKFRALTISFVGNLHCIYLPSVSDLKLTCLANPFSDYSLDWTSPNLSPVDLAVVRITWATLKSRID